MGWQDLTAWMAHLLNGTNVQIVASAVTAVATVILGYATWVLAKETRILSRATSQAHVTLTLEPNDWLAHYVDIVASNSGNGVAYDIVATFDPPLPEGEEGAKHRRNFAVPLQHISILRPGQTMKSNLCEFPKVSRRAYRVTISWKRRPDATKREQLSYDLSMEDYHDVSYLGARSPFTQIAEQMKKLREDWKQVAKGHGRIKADVYTESDREAEETAREEMFRRMSGKDEK